MSPETRVPIISGGGKRRHLTGTASALLAGIVLVMAAVIGDRAVSVTGLLGLGLVVVGLLGVATVPAIFRDQALHLSDDGVRWSGTGSQEWSAPWEEVSAATLHVVRRRSLLGRVREMPVAVSFRSAPTGDRPQSQSWATDTRLVLGSDPATVLALEAALARHAPGLTLGTDVQGR